MTLAIADSGTTNYFISPQTPVTNRSTITKPILVHIANGQSVLSNLTTTLNLQNLSQSTKLAYIMPGFSDNLFSISNLCNSGLYCVFTPISVYAYDPTTKVIKI